MSKVLDFSGDNEFLYQKPSEPSLFLSLGRHVDVYFPPRKRSRISAPFVVSEKPKSQPSIEILPDECLFEVFRRLESGQERSSCACVSKRWLMLLSNICRDEICANNTTTEPEIKSDSQTSNKSTDLKEKDESFDLSVPYEEFQEIDSHGFLSRCLEGKKATDVRLAAISVGTASRGGLGKLSIRGNKSTRRLTDLGLKAVSRGCPSLKVLSLWNLSSVGDEGLSEIANGCRFIEKLDLWKSFIPDLVAAARTSETICENCMTILKLLSEEVFDFSRGEMTQQKIKDLKQSLNSEFQLIHELCYYVLSASQRAQLIRATLAALHAFLSWIPVLYIFASPLLERLLNLFPVPAYRNLTLQCLTEIAAIGSDVSDSIQEVKMYTIFMAQLQAIVPPNTNFQEAYANGNSDEQAFIQNLALFFTTFFKSHIQLLESSQENINALLMGLEYLINISYVDDTEVFKVCLDYWNSLVSGLFEAHHKPDSPAAIASMMGLQMMVLSGVTNGNVSQVLKRRQVYSGPMSKLRLLMICRMAKPEEVLIVEDDNGNIVRETMKDNDVLVLYKIMRETLIYLTHLDHEDTEKQMLGKLSKQQGGEDWSWNNLNTLCWAIGSISGSMREEQENRFLVMVIRDLLNLCEFTKGKDNKAVIASNIMYVVGQYPNFLRAHWKFLKTVVNKLFEFMHESHPGVQDMACDTFLKIVQKIKRKFVILQVGENEPFVSELLTTLSATIADLAPHQIHSFYESVSLMIQAESDPLKREKYLQRLMELPNQKWAEIIGQARLSADCLKDQEVIRTVLNILQTNTSAASSLGTYFLPQISLIFLDMLNVYRMYSELISTTIAQGVPYASKSSTVKLLRSVKRETLKLIETFLDKAEDQPHIGKQFVPPMMDPVLGDYARNLPDARESEVLSLFATIINKYKGAMVEDIPRIFEAVFQCTLEMITKNFEDYPEHRLKFFSLLRAIAKHCFGALIHLSSEQLKLVMDSIIWAFRHTERNIAETGLNLLLEMLKNFQASEFCNQFYRTYFLTIEQEIFAVLTDTFHKPGFKLHVLVLQHLFSLVETGLTKPLWDVATVPYPYPNNGIYIREYTIKLLSSSFPNMTTTEVGQFVNGLFESRDHPSFKNCIRDFLVQSKEFSAQDNKDLYAEEAAAQRERERQHMLSIPGLVAPNEIQDEMDS